jgi:predicted transglutaminase-like cysteine proteinase
MSIRIIIAALIVAQALAGCTAPRIEGTGARAEPPGGWVDYCRRHPKDPSCPA